MPAKKRKKKPAGAVSGVAATLFPLREGVPCLDMSEFRKSPGELIAQAVQSAAAPKGKPGKAKPRRRAGAR